MIAIPRPTVPLAPLADRADGRPLPEAAASFRERLQDLPPEMATALMAAGRPRNWRRGQWVLRQGEHSDALTIGLQGRLAAMLTNAEGQDTLLRWLDDGELVGLPDVLAGLPSPVSIVAQGPASTLHVERDAFVQVLRQHPEGAIGVAVLLSRRLGELFRYVELTGSRPLLDRVVFALQRLARSQGRPDGGGGVLLKVTQADLAMAAGASRQRVQLALKQLQAQGRIVQGYGRVTLLAAPPAALRE